MQHFHKYETSFIVDMLAKHTAEYSRMLDEGLSSESELIDCKKNIALLQEEIDSRKENGPGMEQTTFN